MKWFSVTGLCAVLMMSLTSGILAQSPPAPGPTASPPPAYPRMDSVPTAAPRSQPTTAPSAKPHPVALCTTDSISALSVLADSLKPSSPQPKASSKPSGQGSHPAAAAPPAPTQPPIVAVLQRRIDACKYQIDYFRSDKPYAAWVVDQQQPHMDPVCDSSPKDPYLLMDVLQGCASYVAALNAVVIPTPLYRTALPTLYVIMASGGVPLAKGSKSGSPSSTTSGASTNSTTTSSSSGGSTAPTASAGAGGGTTGIDNPNSLLLFTIAQQLQEALIQKTTNMEVIPASLWTIEDFNAQCIADPWERETDGRLHGTYGALLLDGSTTNDPSEFGLLFTAGWTRARYHVTVVTCDNPPTFQSVERWSDFVEGYNRRIGISFVPVAGYFAYLASKWQQQTTLLLATPAPAASGAPAVSTSPAPVDQGTVINTAGLQGLGNFLAGTSNLSIGDTSAPMTVPRAFSDLAKTLTKDFIRDYCDPNIGLNAELCKAREVAKRH